MSFYYSHNDCSGLGFCPGARDHGAPRNKTFKQHELMLIPPPPLKTPALKQLWFLQVAATQEEAALLRAVSEARNNKGTVRTLTTWFTWTHSLHPHSNLRRQAPSLSSLYRGGNQDSEGLSGTALVGIKMPFPLPSAAQDAHILPLELTLLYMARRLCRRD